MTQGLHLIAAFTCRQEVCMADAMLRQWSLLRSIPRSPRRVDTTTLLRRLQEDGFTVGQRTVQRDLHRLSEIFPLMLDKRTVPFGWSWMRTGERPPWG